MIFILIPVFNEEDNIGSLAKNLIEFKKNNNEEFFFVFVDDCSSDKTVELINLYFNDLNFTILLKEFNKGPGDSFQTGFEWILEYTGHPKSTTDLVITIEADNTSDLDILSVMISLANQKFDLVLASVYAQGGGFEKTGLIRVVLSFLANVFFRAFFDIKVLTLSSFYRVYRLELIQRIKVSNKKLIEEPGFISMLEILLKSIKVNASIIEVPMKLRSSNRIGKSKMKLFKTFASYIHFLLKAKLKH
jgi:glycosyltransferase involved in cell wall biosynthesis